MRADLKSIQIIFLITLQVVTLPVLWLMNPVAQVATDTFALYLSLDLLAFVLISYIYRTRSVGREPSAAWLSVGYLAIIVLLVSNLMMTA
ncbi:MAG: hypothetical protein JRM73_05225 [Nitrososphaerota archaeon]|nr:hypothetical protein [Nitrososphaerota archaeon]